MRISSGVLVTALIAAAAPAGSQQFEKPAAVNGTQWAVIAPTYTGTGGTDSYIRLFNGGATAASFTIKIISTPAGADLGTAVISVPPRASPQKSLGDILAAAGLAVQAGVGYSLYIQSFEQSAGYQHVTFNGVNLFFENNSSCKNLLNSSIASVVNSAALINVHTTFLANYPSQVDIHNYWNAAVTYRVTVINASTGDIKGTVNVPIAANATVSNPMSYFQTQVGWSPTTGAEAHANLVVTDPSGAPPYVTLNQSIINNALNASINMATACGVNAPVAASDGGGGVGGGGGISY